MKNFLIAILATLCFASIRTAAPADLYAPFVTLAGADSKITSAKCERILTEEAWKALWLEHCPKIPMASRAALAQVPTVDFKSCMVIAVFLGASSNTNGVRFISGSVDDKEVLLGIGALSYQVGSVGDNTSPYGFLILPRSTKPVRIQMETNRMRGSAPIIWSEYKSFPAVEDSK